MTSLIAFDMDGVLFSSEPFVAQAYREAMETVNARKPGTLPRVPSAREILDHIGWPVRVIQERLFPGLDEASGDLLYEETSNAMAAHAVSGDGYLYPDVPDTLRTLRQSGHALCVASNGRRSYVEGVLRTYGLRDLFLPSITADEVGSKEAVLRGYLRRHDLTRDRLVMIGDRASDAEAALAVGCHFIGCDYGHGYRREIEAAGPVVGRFSDLPATIERLLSNPL